MLSWLASHDTLNSRTTTGKAFRGWAPFNRLEKNKKKTDRAKIVSGTNREEGHVEMSRSLNKQRGETPGSHPDQ